MGTQNAAMGGQDVIETLVIGAGMSGICMAVKLLESGRTSFAVLERSSGVGGTWRQNRYPGCCCDVPSYLYCFSFDRNPRWDHVFADRRQIESYVHSVAARYGVMERIRFHTEVVSATWNGEATVWHVEAIDTNGESSSWVARFLVRATGNFGMPRFPGSTTSVVRERFEGTWFHSRDWPSDGGLEMARGRVVAVVGTGASAIQIVPELARVARKLYVCQRTPAWILPKPNLGIARGVRRVLARVPVLLSLFWWSCLLFQEMFLGVALLGGLCARPFHTVVMLLARLHLWRSIRDPELRSSLRPSYEIGCKRILLSSSFYPSLALPNVELLRGSVVDVRPHSLVLSRPDARASPLLEKRIDLIVYATGFDMWTPTFPIIGDHGLPLRADAAAYLGTTTSRFPNFFMLLGPNTGIGHTSQILLIEAQVRYVVSCMRLVHQRHPFTRALQLRVSSEKRFEEFLAKRLSRTVWRKGGCSSAYINPHTGKIDIIWPALVLEYMFRTRSASLDDYNIIS